MDVKSRQIFPAAVRALGEGQEAVSPRVATGAVEAAERAVIGAILNDNDLINAAYGTLDGADFAVDGHREVFVAIENAVAAGFADAVVVSAGAAHPLMTVEYLQSIAVPMAPEAFSAYVQVLVRASAEREVSKGLAKISSSTDKVVELAHLAESAAKIAGRGISKATTIAESAFEAAQRVVEHADRGGGIIGYPTGLTDLDNLISGLQSKFYVIGARPSMGKTALVLNFAQSLLASQPADDKGCFLFGSYEMPAAELAKRLIIMESGLDAERVSRGILTTEEWEIFTEATERVAAMNIVIVTDESIESLYAQAEKLHASGLLRGIAADYLQLMTSNKRTSASNRQEQISEISRTFKKMTNRFNVPVLALSQLSRKIEERANKRPVMSDLRESGAIEQDADVIIMLYRDDYYDRNSSDKGVAEVDVVKQRDGSTATLKAKFDRQHSKFSDLRADTKVLVRGGRTARI